MVFEQGIGIIPATIYFRTCHPYVYLGVWVCDYQEHASFVTIQKQQCIWSSMFTQFSVKSRWVDLRPGGKLSESQILSRSAIPSSCFDGQS